MNELHLFAGAGGGILGGILLGHTCVCAVEIEPYCREVLLQRQRDGILPKFPIWDDVTTFDGNPWRGLVDVVCGGFPCQDISAAGKGKGIRGGERSGLWAEFARIIGEVQPAYVFVENSPMLTIRGLDIVLGDLATLGYDARWGVLGAHNIGGVIARDRIWIIASPCKKHGGGIYGRPDKKQGDMGEYIQIRSFIDRYLEEMERQGTKWETYGESDMPPYLCRMDNDVADKLEQLKAIGNGQVPAVVALAWRLLS